MTASNSQTQAQSRRSAPDAVGRGVLGHDPDGAATLFVLAGNSLGSTPIGVEGAPQWYDLRTLVNLDAVGDPVGARLPVEASFDGGGSIEAMWPEPFCDRVITRLRELLDAGQMLPRQGDAAGAGMPAVAEQNADSGPIEASSEEAPPAVAPVAAPPTPQHPAPVQPEPMPPVATAPPEPAVATAPLPPAGTPDLSAAAPADAPLWANQDHLPLPGDGPPLAGAPQDGAGALTLEDVVYHGGYPGQTKKRKKCVAVLDPSGVTVNGPHGPDFRLGWEVVRSVEAQNSDEAKFRLGVKAKRNSTVLVLDCDQGVTIVIEAHDVPTMPLKSALHELLGGGPVAVT